jgi:hypothetical protein
VSSNYRLKYGRWKYDARRYYARFIVVCLLLNKMNVVRDLVQDLEAQIADYNSAYEPDDHVDWTHVLDELKAFVKADSAVAVLRADSNVPVVLPHRLGPLTSPPVERSTPMCLSLQEILIVGNCANQVLVQPFFHPLSTCLTRLLPRFILARTYTNVSVCLSVCLSVCACACACACTRNDLSRLQFLLAASGSRTLHFIAATMARHRLLNVGKSLSSAP